MFQTPVSLAKAALRRYRVSQHDSDQFDFANRRTHVRTRLVRDLTEFANNLLCLWILLSVLPSSILLRRLMRGYYDMKMRLKSNYVFCILTAT